MSASDPDYTPENEADDSDAELPTVAKGGKKTRTNLTPWEMVQLQKKAKKKEVLYSDDDILDRFLAQNCAFTYYPNCFCVTSKNNRSLKCNCFQHLLYDAEDDTQDGYGSENGLKLRSASQNFNCILLG